MQKSKKQKFHIRPRFKVETPLSKEEIRALFSKRLKAPDAPCSGKIRGDYIALFPKAKDKHYWSPHLSITIDDNEIEGKHLLRGLYGPSPSVWSMFMLFYVFLSVMLLIVMVVGFGNRSLGLSSVILWLVPVILIVILSLYLIAYFGQKKGHDQIEMIHGFLEEVLGHKVGDPPVV